MLRSKLFVIIAGLMTCLTVYSQQSFEEAVKAAVNGQLKVYPYSTLRDLYKNFFQDKFGPGHLIQDTVAAEKYLRKELASFGQTEGAYYEPTGWEHNFYRVNLSVIKEELIPYDCFFDAFVRSVSGIVPVSVDVWAKEWMAIDSIICSMDLTLFNYETDRTEIFDLLKQGKYVMHHSKEFEANYSPHYRIIERSVFEKKIRPLLPK